MLVARRSRPTVVTRGSCATLNNGPPPRSLRCVMSPIRRSASTLIERSFGIAKVVPLRPTRRWRKSTGPRSSTLMATAPIIRIGAVTTSTRAASVTSSSRLTNRWKPRSRGTSRQSSVSCPIGAGADLTMVDAAQPGVHSNVGARSPEREELGVGGLAPERVRRRDDDRRAGGRHRLHEIVARTDVGHTPTRGLRCAGPDAAEDRPTRLGVLGDQVEDVGRVAPIGQHDDPVDVRPAVPQPVLRLGRPRSVRPAPLPLPVQSPAPNSRALDRPSGRE